MNIAVDIGNTNLKCGLFLPDGGYEVHGMSTDSLHDAEKLYRNLLCWDLLYTSNLSPVKVFTATHYPDPITWCIAQTGEFPSQKLQVAIRRWRPQDHYIMVNRKKIPLKVAVNTPEKVGIDRLLAAYAAVELYGDIPMLIVDAGTAITIDVVQNRTFCGGAILPGLTTLSETYPRISGKLPVVPVPLAPECAKMAPPDFPGKTTEDAIHSGLYWGTIGAIMQFCGMFFCRAGDVCLILAGGDSQYLLPEITRILTPPHVQHHKNLVLEGIHWCFEK